MALVAGPDGEKDGETAELPQDVNIPAKLGQCPACLQEFGVQDKDRQHFLSLRHDLLCRMLWTGLRSL